MQEIIDTVSILFLWIIGITCIPIMRKINPLQYKLYTVYDMSICVITTIFAILYLCK